jgi:GDP-L-fucose synthase
VSRLAHLGWRATIGLEQGLRDAYQWFAAQQPR